MQFLPIPLVIAGITLWIEELDARGDGWMLASPSESGQMSWGITPASWSWAEELDAEVEESNSSA